MNDNSLYHDSQILDQFYEDVNNLSVVEAAENCHKFKEFNYYQESLDDLDNLFKLFQENSIFGVLDFTTPNKIHPLELTSIQTKWNAIPPIVKAVFLNRDNINNYAKTIDFSDQNGPQGWTTNYLYVHRYLLLMIYNIAVQRPSIRVIRKWVVKLEL